MKHNVVPGGRVGVGLAVSAQVVNRATLLLAIVYLLGGLGQARAGLVVYFDFNDPNNLTRDASGNGHNATNFNGVTYDASGFTGGAARFNGTNSFLRVAVDVDIDVMPKMTWGAWVRPDQVNGIRAILSDDNGGFDRNINIDNRAGGDFASFRGGTGGGVFDSNIAPNPGAWTFIAAVYNQTTNSMTYYVDGSSFVVTTNFNGTPHNFFEIGHNPSFNEFWSGRIDNVFVYNEALTATEIANIRTNGIQVVTGVPAPGAFILLGSGGLVLGPFALWRRRHRAG